MIVIDSVFVATALTAVVIVYRAWAYRQPTRISLADVSGPESASFTMSRSLLFVVLSMADVAVRESERILSIYQGQALPGRGD